MVHYSKKTRVQKISLRSCDLESAKIYFSCPDKRIFVFPHLGRKLKKPKFSNVVWSYFSINLKFLQHLVSYSDGLSFSSLGKHPEGTALYWCSRWRELHPLVQLNLKASMLLADTGAMRPIGSERRVELRHQKLIRLVAVNCARA